MGRSPSRLRATAGLITPQDDLGITRRIGTMANATMSKDEILDAIGNMSVFELAELIEAFKTKFNVTIAAAPVGGGAPAGGGAGAGAAAPVEEQTEVDVVLKEAGAKKI